MHAVSEDVRAGQGIMSINKNIYQNIAFMQLMKNMFEGQGYSSEAQRLPDKRKVLSLIHSTKKYTYIHYTF